MDRVGLVNDVTEILAKRGINMVAVEVERGAVFLEYEPLQAIRQGEVEKALAGIPGINAIEAVACMPSKEKAEKLDAVLTSVQDGILAVDHKKIITQCNPAAAQILRFSDNEAAGMSIESLAAKLFINEALNRGRITRNREVFLESINSYCVVSTIPLRNHDGEVSGAVVVVRDAGEVRELFRKMTGAQPISFEDIPYVSPVMERVVRQARRYAASDSTVLIMGETGTGKELFARALHGNSRRGKAAFVPINCAAIPDTLLESELFGYEEGAFTGAAKGGKPGMFELANGGTLFLDEIGELSAHLQAKLLRALQERRVRRLGSPREQDVDVRIIAATNRDLEDLVARRAFREDLYYRLNVIPLLLPPLRDRSEDVELLANYFLRRFSGKLKRPVSEFGTAAMAKLRSYAWPGNVRELENVIERAVNLVEGPKIQAEHISLGKMPSGQGYMPTVSYETYQTLAERMAEVERMILEETLKRFKSSRRVGAVLGLSHTGVLKKIRRFGLSCEKDG
jgi:transcriptional regulator of aroF, aroG, tyrA and aromatic amino acid transport